MPPACEGTGRCFHHCLEASVLASFMTTADGDYDAFGDLWYVRFREQNGANDLLNPPLREAPLWVEMSRVNV
jgi:hypothetical protein